MFTIAKCGRRRKHGRPKTLSHFIVNFLQGIILVSCGPDSRKSRSKDWEGLDFHYRAGPDSSSPREDATGLGLGVRI